jgi:transcription-repair coupling factor (superfamily II helicase)
MLSSKKISYQTLFNTPPHPGTTVSIEGVTQSQRAYLTYRIYKAFKQPLLVVLSNDKEAQIFMEDLRFFSKKIELPLIYFPAYHLLPVKIFTFNSETSAERISALYHLTELSSPFVAVTTINALMQKIIPKANLLDYAELLIEGEEINLDQIIRKLIAGGYSRTMIVEEQGDFCLRGGILDIFSPLYSEPLRLELFGDWVESLRFFSPDTQRTRQNVNEAVILPAREVIVAPNEMDAVVTRIRKQAALLEMPVRKVRNLIHRIKEEGIFTGIESLLPLIYPHPEILFDYLSPHTILVQIEPGDLHATVLDATAQLQKNYDDIRKEKDFCLPPESLYSDWTQLVDRVSTYGILSFRKLSILTREDGIAGSPIHCSVETKENDDLSKAIQTAARTEVPFSPLVDWVHMQKHSKRTVLFVGRTRSQADRIQNILKPYGFNAVLVEGFPDLERVKGMVLITIGFVSNGFIWPDESLALLTEEEIFGSHFKRRKIVAKKARAELLGLQDLKQGDLVVHNEHGIGRYGGLVKLSLDNTVNDFLLLTYKDDDKLYLPVERMGLVQKYMGVDNVIPVLDKMGGKSWERVKARVKKNTEKIAGELLKIYAARKVKKGHAFGTADSYFRDFEAGFPFEETIDQAKAIEDVIEDMRRSTSMDRLVCGDVGYGKTEVALRAAFLAVSEVKQVAVLVPTTVLAEQHYSNFVERFSRYPVTVACLNRFRSQKEQREIVSGIKTGIIDIVIGTHRLLQKDVAFKDLGLVVLDEEQWFGVKHKEKLKQLRNMVDVLTLTATPIPRTLHLSLMGIRDISIISTPPEDRHPIRTYVMEYEDDICAQAIEKELKRGGQIFFVHNNISSIDRMAAHIQELVPNVRLAVAHGRMAERDLEKVMLLFMQKEIDLLVCTTIIESGLDISSANTILVNRADRFGLAQIYQLRGRVGRSDEQAYAYLFIPSESALTADAVKRLKVLMEYSDLGSGFQIAMNDLKIRGGGAILGASQSGHIAAVGYDMFLKLMEESVAELKGEPLNEDLEPEINLTISAFLAESYVMDIDQRLTLYRRLAQVTDLKQIANLKAELEDRYGKVPVEGVNLLLKIMLKVLSIKGGIKRLDLIGQQLTLSFSEVHQKHPFGIVEMVMENRNHYQLTPDHLFKAVLKPGNSLGLLKQTKNILIEIVRRVNK